MNRSEPGQNRKIAALRIFRACHKQSPAFFFVNAPFLNLRQNPCRESKVTSQVIYSEAVEILSVHDNWFHIQTEDGYVGWVGTDSESFITQQESFTDIACVSRAAAHIYHVKDTEFGPILTLPLDSCLALVNYESSDVDSRWLEVRLLDGRLAYVQRGDIEINPVLKTKQEIVELALSLPPLPYTWGGRSSIYGFDCSGLVQFLYKQMGVMLPRDSKDQVNWEGFRGVSLDALTPGDLIFFGQSKDSISHVGMSLGGIDFIHTSPRENQPWIRKSKLTDSAWNGKDFHSTSFRIGRQL